MDCKYNNFNIELVKALNYYEIHLDTSHPDYMYFMHPSKDFCITFIKDFPPRYHTDDTYFLENSDELTLLIKKYNEI